MPQVNTNYTFPIPPENVYGQTISGPSTQRPQSAEQPQTQSETQQPQTTQETKGRYVDTYA